MSRSQQPIAIINLDACQNEDAIALAFFLGPISKIFKGSLSPWPWPMPSRSSDFKNISQIYFIGDELDQVQLWLKSAQCQGNNRQLL